MTLTTGYGPYAFAVGEIDLVKIEVVEFAGSGACFGRMDCLRLAGALSTYGYGGEFSKAR
jgi:hypothetical protein